MNHNVLLSSINKSSTVITDELIPQRYNSTSKVKVELPEWTGMNSASTVKISSRITQEKDKSAKNDETNK